jgi:hypothetical protein
LKVGGRVTRQAGGLVGLCVGHLRLEVVVDQQPPDVLVRDVADELLDVDAPVAELTALAVWLGDLRLDRDDPLQTGLEVVHRAESTRTGPNRRSARVAAVWRTESR